MSALPTDVAVKSRELVNPVAPDALESRAADLVLAGVTVEQLRVEVRRNEGLQRPLISAPIPYAEFDEAALVGQLKPGEYMAFLVVRGPNASKFRGNRAEYRFTVSPEMGRTDLAASSAAGVSRLPASPAAPAFDVAGVLMAQVQALQQQNTELTLRMIDRAAPPPAPPPPNRTKELLDMLVLLKELRTLGREESAPSSGGELATMAREFLSAFRGGSVISSKI